MRALLRCSSVAVMIVLLGLAGCGSDEIADPRIEEIKGHVDECGRLLSAAEYRQARVAADEVLGEARLDTFDHLVVDQARFCRTTAHTLHHIDELSSKVEELLSLVLELVGEGDGDVLGGLDGFSPSDGPAGFTVLAETLELFADRVEYESQFAPQGDLLRQILLGYFSGFEAALRANQKELDKIIANDQFEWRVSRLPIRVAGWELLDAGGRYDMAEIHLLYGTTRTIIGIFDSIRSIRLTPNSISETVDYVMNVTGETTPLGRFSTHPVSAVLNAGSVLLAMNTRFLALDSNGRERLADAGDGFSDGWDGILKSLRHMRHDRTGDQSAFLLEYNRERDEDREMLILNFSFEADPIPFLSLREIDKVEVPLRDNILESIEIMRDNFAGISGSQRVSLQDDVFPMVGLMATVLLNSGVFDALISLALDEVGGESAEEIRGLIDIFGGDPEIVSAFLSTIVPVGMEFDFGAAFHESAGYGLRDMLPAWFEPTAAEIDDLGTHAFATATLVLSYECEDPTYNPLQDENGEEYTCDSVQDSGHFEDLDPGSDRWFNNPTSGNFEWEPGRWQGPIKPDGIDSPIPYIGFKEPSFGGVLYLRPGDVDDSRAGDSMEEATQQTLNAAVAKIIGSLVGLAGF